MSIYQIIWVGGKFAGSIWHPIKTHEMFRALGILLKMSLDNHQLGGYHSYFTPPVELFSSPTDSISIKRFTGWASDVMKEY